tara:strand:+ start:349 stop:600 length:252 start_codon:yes stop_codon:yes gene_type:complete
MSYVKYNIFEKVGNTIFNPFKHPANVCMTYAEHAKFSFYLSFVFFKAASKGVIHSIYPDIYITYAQDTIKEVNNLLKNSGCKD